MDKLVSLEQAVSRIQDGALVGIGGNTLHRAPMALVRELARQKKKALRIVKTAGAMDVDLLCFAGCVQSVDAGFISYETQYGLAGHYRRGVQEGRICANEHACYTVISALRAAAYGVGFMPVRGMQVSELIERNDYFTRMKDPFTGEEITAVRALRPDVAILHVQEADAEGNARIFHPQYDDLLLSRASRQVIVTAEKILPSTYFTYAKQKADIPHFMVTAVVHSPNGAYPSSCPGVYEIDAKGVAQFQKIQTTDELEGYLLQLRQMDGRQGGRVSK